MIRVPGIAGKKVAVFGLGKAGRAAVDALLNSEATVYAWDDNEASRAAVSIAASASGSASTPTPLQPPPASGERLKSPSIGRLKSPPPLAGEEGKAIGRAGGGVTDGGGAKSDVMPHLLPPGTWPWGALEFLALSPGVPLTHPTPHEVAALAEKNGCPILGEVELLWRAQADATFVGITGTNGKSTTTALVAHILHVAGKRVEVGGNLGVPALALAPLGANGIYVLEMSSYQLDLIHDAQFHVAALLNITPDHLDRHGGMEGYVAAKKKIFANRQPGDVAVIAVDDESTSAMAAEFREKNHGRPTNHPLPNPPPPAGQQVGIGFSCLGNDGGETNSENDKKETSVVTVSTSGANADIKIDANGTLHDGTVRTDLSHLPSLAGRHNWQNAGVAYAVARALGVSSETVARALATFKGLAHRMETVATMNGVRFVNDSKATNADAAQHALAAFENIYWIAGGRPKAGGIASLARFFPKIAHAFLIGEAEAEFAATLLEGKTPFTKCGTLSQAVQAASAMALRENSQRDTQEGGAQDNVHGTVVLLSPACASFDQFASFEARGDAFREMVEQLEKNRHCERTT